MIKGVENKYVLFIKEVLKKYITDKNAKIYIFGSRAKNTYKEYSDIDIAIDAINFTKKDKTRLELEFENSTLPYKVDIVDMNNIKDNFKNLIKNDLILFM